MGWSIYDYVEPSGANPYVKWHNGLPEEAQSAIDERLLAMEGLDKWSEKWASDYKGRKKIIELRIPHNKVQYRPLGMYQPNKVFVLLGGAIEKNGKLPTSTLDAVEERRDGLLANPNRIIPHV